MPILLLVLLLLLIFGGLPGGPISHEYGFAPSGLASVLLIVLLVLLLTGRL